MARKPHGYTDEDLDMLTEEELAGLEDETVVDEGARVGADDDDTEEEVTAAAAAEDKTAAEHDADAAKTKAADDNADDETKADDSKPEEDKKPAAGDPPVTEEQKAEEEIKVETSPPAPRLLPQYEVPADAKDRITNIDTQLDELAKKFDDGEMTAMELRAAQKPLEQQRQDLRDQLLKQSLSFDSQVAAWSNVTVPAFLDKHPEYEPGSVLYDALNKEVQKLQMANDNPFDATYLAKAHATVQASVRKSLGLPAEPADKQKKEEKAKREIPPTLGGLPAADMNDANDGGEFAYLDRLADKDPLAFESALGKLSEEKREMYLQQ